MATEQNISEDYAVLFAGGISPSRNFSRYYNSLKGLYEVLRDQHGIAQENIIVLYANAESDTRHDQAYGFGSIDEIVRLGVDPFLAESIFNEQLEFKKATANNARLSRAEAEGFEENFADLNKRLGGLLKIDYQYEASDKDDGDYLAQVVYFASSDMTFASGSSVLSANGSALQSALTEVAGRVDSNDHVFFWTFDHGDFGEGQGNLIAYNDINPKWLFGRRDVGNQARLNGWGSDAIGNAQLAQWVAPVIESAGYATLVYNQCFSGGMLAASESAIDSADYAYGIAATNQYEQSINYAFAEGIRIALEAGRPLASELFATAKDKDQFAFKGAYEPNAGEPKYPWEHPWAYGDGAFQYFRVMILLIL